MHNLKQIVKSFLNKNKAVLPEYAEDFLSDALEWQPGGEDDLSDLAGALNTYRDDLTIDIPSELIAYNFSKWSGKQIPINHDLIINAYDYTNALRDLDFAGQGKSDPNLAETITRLRIALRGTIIGHRYNELITQLNYLQKLDSSPTREGAYIIEIEDIGRVQLVVLNNIAAFKIGDQIKAFDVDTCERTDIADDVFEAKTKTPKIVDSGELDSIIGNKLADEVRGVDGISILDLP